MQQKSLMVLAGLIAAASLAAGCVPALNYGSVPPEPQYTTKFTTTTVPTTERPAFTTHKRKKRTISYDELNGTYYVANTTARKNSHDDDGTETTYTGGTGMSGYYGTTGTGASGIGTAVSTGAGHSGVQSDNTTAQTKKWVLVTDETIMPDTAPVETPAQETPAPEPEPIETPAPVQEPEPAAPEPEPEPEPVPDPAAEPVPAEE